MFKNIGVLILAIGIVSFISSCSKDDELAENDMYNQSGQDYTDYNLLKQVNISGSSSFSLLAGQDIPAGTVDVEVVGDNLIVTYNTSNGFELNEVHFFIGETLSDMPQTKTGSPKIGNFPYAASGLQGTTTYSFTVSIPDLGGEPYVCGKTFFLATHASVYRVNSDGSYQQETAWGDGERFTQRGSWATYFAVDFTCTDDPVDPKSCETAFALGSKTFIELELTNSRWGWMITVDEQGTFEAPMYAGAGQNDLSKGTLVGKLIYSFDGDVLSASVEMFEGYTMSETQLYASNLLPESIAPGQYGNIHDLDDASSDSYSVEITGGTPVYLIMHAVVCE